MLAWRVLPAPVPYGFSDKGHHPRDAGAFTLDSAATRVTVVDGGAGERFERRLRDWRRRPRRRADGRPACSRPAIVPTGRTAAARRPTLHPRAPPRGAHDPCRTECATKGSRRCPPRPVARPPRRREPRPRSHPRRLDGRGVWSRRDGTSGRSGRRARPCCQLTATRTLLCRCLAWRRALVGRSRGAARR